MRNQITKKIEGHYVVYTFENEKQALVSYEKAVKMVEKEFFMKSHVVRVDGLRLFIPVWLPFVPAGYQKSV